MNRTLFAPLLALGLAGLAAPVPASASAAAPHYQAELAAPAGADRVVARRLVWHCAATACVAAKSNSRPAIECAALAKKAGPLRSFVAAGEALNAAALEKCNARAR